MVNTAQRLLVSYHLENISIFKQANSSQTELPVVTKTCLSFSFVSVNVVHLSACPNINTESFTHKLKV